MCVEATVKPPTGSGPESKGTPTAGLLCKDRDKGTRKRRSTVVCSDQSNDMF